MLGPRSSKRPLETSQETAEVICRDWYEAYGAPLYNYLRFHLPSPDLAEDLTAEVFRKSVCRERVS